MNKDYEKRIAELERIVKSLSSSTTIPLNIDGAFRKRLSLNKLAKSSKVSSSENRTVNEAGTGTYTVLKSPDGFLEVSINGIKYYTPYYV